MKFNKKLIFIICGVILIAILCGIVVFILKASNHNKKVDMVAQTYTELMDEVDYDGAKPTNSWKLSIGLYKARIALDVNDGKLNEDALTYYDGSKKKYDELNTRFHDIVNKHSLASIPAIPWSNSYLDSLNKDELKTLFEDFKNFKNELDEVLRDKSLWNDDSWSIIWGDKKDEAMEVYESKAKTINTCYENLEKYIDLHT